MSESAQRHAPTWRELMRQPEYREGLRDMAAVAPGLAAWGLMTGVASRA
jgi:hypothetical protein